MKRGAGFGFFGVGFMIVLLALCAGCHKNEKLDLDNTQPEADGDTEPDADGDGEESTAVLPSYAKWVTPHYAALTVDSTGTIYALNKAGLTVFAPGDLEDETDDQVITHHELTLENWPAENPASICADQQDNIWLATETRLFLYLPQDTPFDASDDALIEPSLGENSASSREFLNLYCNPAGAGVLASTNFGFVTLVPGDDPSDATAFTVADYNGSSSSLSNRPYSAAVDGEGVLWLTLYTETGYELHAVQIGAFEDSSDDQDHTVPFGFENAQPTSLSVDGTDAIWINSKNLKKVDSSDTRVWHLTHNKTYADSSDDSWVMMPEINNVASENFISAGPGRLLATNTYDANLGMIVYSNSQTETEDDDQAEKLPDFGLAEDHRLRFAIYQENVGMWYSSDEDFALLVLAEDVFADGIDVHHFSNIGHAPSNDLPAAVMASDGMYLGGTGTTVRVNYDADTAFEDFAFTTYDLNHEEDPTPFDARAIIPYRDGVLVGGTTLAYLYPDGSHVLWNGTQGMEDVVAIAQGPDNLLWTSQYSLGLLTIASFNVYDPKNLDNASDDVKEGITTEFFGKSVGQTVDAILFYDGCKALTGNIYGLFNYDCMGTTMDTDDDTATELSLDSARKAGSQVTEIRNADENGFWVMTVLGLMYFNMGTSGDDTSDDSSVSYSDVSGPSFMFEVDANGLLYYFLTDKLVIHDPKGTPADPSDDEAAVVELPGASRQSTLALDDFNGIWIGLGDASGLIYLRPGDLSFSPLAEALQ